MTIDLDAIEAAARAATPGPWKWNDDYEGLSGNGEPVLDYYQYEGMWLCQHERGEANAAHIAAADPATVLALCRIARAALDCVNTDDPRWSIGAYSVMKDALRDAGLLPVKWSVTPGGKGPETTLPSRGR